MGDYCGSRRWRRVVTMPLLVLLGFLVPECISVALAQPQTFTVKNATLAPWCVNQFFESLAQLLNEKKYISVTTINNRTATHWTDLQGGMSDPLNSREDLLRIAATEGPCLCLFFPVVDEFFSNPDSGGILTFMRRANLPVQAVLQENPRDSVVLSYSVPENAKIDLQKRVDEYARDGKLCRTSSFERRSEPRCDVKEQGRSPNACTTSLPKNGKAGDSASSPWNQGYIPDIKNIGAMCAILLLIVILWRFFSWPQPGPLQRGAPGDPTDRAMRAESSYGRSEAPSEGIVQLRDYVHAEVRRLDSRCDQVEKEARRASAQCDGIMSRLGQLDAEHAVPRDGSEQVGRAGLASSAYGPPPADEAVRADDHPIEGVERNKQLQRDYSRALESPSEEQAFISKHRAICLRKEGQNAHQGYGCAVRAAGGVQVQDAVFYAIPDEKPGDWLILPARAYMAQTSSLVSQGGEGARGMIGDFFSRRGKIGSN